MLELLRLHTYFPRDLRWLVWSTLLFAPFAALVEVAALASSVPFLEALSTGFKSSQVDAIPTKALVFASFLFAATIVRLMSLWLGSHVGAHVGHQLSSRVLLRFLSIPYESFISIHSSHVLATTIQHTSQVGLAFRNLIQLLQSACTCLALFAALIYINPVAASALFLSLSCLYLLIYRVSRRLLDRFSAENVLATADQLRIANESLGAIRDIQLSSTQSIAVASFAEADIRYRRSTSHIEVLSASPRFILEFILLASIALLSVLMSSSDVNSIGILPLLGVFAFGGQRIIPALQQCFASQAVIRSSSPALSIVRNALGQTAAHEMPASPQFYRSTLASLQRERPLLSIRNASYQYPDSQSPAIYNLSLDVNPGECIGIVGSTGSGKSTLLDIMMGLLIPQSGEITFDIGDYSLAHDVTEQIAAWRQKLAHVPQDVFITDSTFQGNITFDTRHGVVESDRMIQAAKSAHIHYYIESLPQGYQTVVGERGAMLSGGQRQRLGIARAVYKQPSLLILDEATSALDSSTESLVLDAIHQLRHKSPFTLIIVSHNRATLNRCDRIIELMPAPKHAVEHIPPYPSEFLGS